MNTRDLCFSHPNGSQLPGASLWSGRQSGSDPQLRSALHTNGEHGHDHDDDDDTGKYHSGGMSQSNMDASVVAVCGGSDIIGGRGGGGAGDGSGRRQGVLYNAGAGRSRNGVSGSVAVVAAMAVRAACAKRRSQQNILHH